MEEPINLRTLNQRLSCLRRRRDIHYMPDESFLPIYCVGRSRFAARNKLAFLDQFYPIPMQHLQRFMFLMNVIVQDNASRVHQIIEQRIMFNLGIIHLRGH